QLEESLVARLERRLLGPPARGTADVERPHRQLRTGLADRLCRDDPDGLADVHVVPTGQIAPVAPDTHTLSRLAGEHGADLHALEAGILDERDLGLVDLLVRPDDDRAGEGIADVLERDPPEHPIAQPFDDLPALHEGGHLDAVERSAVLFGDDGILRN